MNTQAAAPWSARLKSPPPPMPARRTRAARRTYCPPLRVMLRVAPGTQQIVAVLHDVVEESDEKSPSTTWHAKDFPRKSSTACAP
ncbi:hypothetical protein [Janthinobacterium sp. PSPC2-1]|uniref:hypothetical protein n=1 Tax=unclassified Janthinobacterium TaxID=2610881 RepID=UPI003CF3E9FE